MKFRSISLVIGLGLALVTSASATSLSGSMAARPGFGFGVSFDGPNAGVMQRILSSGLTDGVVYSFGQFDAASNPYLVVSEIAGYAGSNTMGFLDNNNNYIPFVLGANTIGNTGNASTSGTPPYILASTSPGAGADFWYSIDGRNSDHAAHFIGLRVTGNGAVTFPGFAASTLGSVTLQAGDIIVGMEDLPFAESDRDFNDLALVMRAVPEPASMLLLGSGLLAAGFSRKKRA